MMPRRGEQGQQGHQEQTVRIPHLRLLPAPAAPQERREPRPLRAVVFLPAGTPAAGTWTEACGQYIQRRGYLLAAVVGVWKDAMRLIFGGEADVIVVGRRDHMPDDRLPRVDIVTEQKLDTPPSHRRPRRM